MSILRINIVFFGPNMVTASLDILNTKRLIFPERESFRRLKFCQVYIGIIYVLLVM